MLEGGLNVDYFILLLALLLILGVVTTKFSSKFGLPALVLFIGLGMLAGSDGLNFIYFDDPHIAQLVGVIALIIILFEGGLQTKWTDVRPILYPSLSLATFGVFLTTAVVAAAVKFLLNVTWLEAFLFGSIVGSTDAAAVFSVLSGKNVRDKLAATLEAESGSNDPMAVFLTITFIELLTRETSSVFSLIFSFFWQMGMGIVFGYLFGKLAVYAINRIHLESSGLYPVFALSFAILCYGITMLAGASGLLAVYVAAVLMGNNHLTYKNSIVRFNEGFAWMMQILMFAILGLLVFPSELFHVGIMVEGMLISLILIFIARPIGVFLSTIFSPFNFKEKVFLSWSGLRGAVPIVLATFPLIEGVENSQLFFNLVFFVVLTSALVQGSTIPWFAQKLKLTEEEKPTSPHVLELVSIGKANAEIVEFFVPAHAKIVGQTLEQITLPVEAIVSAMIRGDELITPTGQTEIHANDILYIMVNKNKLKPLTIFLSEQKVEPNSV
ncbi:potassium/proton antiporter [Fictibacillus phosphorivorans]|uniref:potassium/proton antiporter n=1 Tax=Fictibacillus phosphorivorans TaxID=1221500 RepID=UPI00203DE7C8|nr:potassium/proton antiporter [Fictibacillus phosphorivorans]MCM3719236.1 potassium/proton antiporter [Fictibacillus phosphorivorans]MCM3776858.1 potassium/proton antiporter [Fictibacillus phosphorivorans]